MGELVGCNSAAYCTKCKILGLPLRRTACRITAVTVSLVGVTSLPSIYWKVHPTFYWSVIATFCAKRYAVLSRCDLFAAMPSWTTFTIILSNMARLRAWLIG